MLFSQYDILLGGNTGIREGKYDEKRIFLSFLQMMVMISLIASFIGNNTNAANYGNMDMDHLARGVSQNSGAIIEWSLHTRETIDLSEKDRFIHNLKSQFPGWVWTVSSENGLDNVTGRMEHDDFRETIKVVTMEDGGSSYSLYEVTGKVWNTRISKKIEKSSSPEQTNYLKIMYLFSLVSKAYSMKIPEIWQTICCYFSRLRKKRR